MATISSSAGRTLWQGQSGPAAFEGISERSTASSLSTAALARSRIL